LSVFLAAAEEKDQFLSVEGEVDPVAGSEVILLSCTPFPTVFTFGLRPASSFATDRETLAAAKASRASNHEAKGLWPSLSSYSRVWGMGQGGTI
jgi:hypothetical protein